MLRALVCGRERVLSCDSPSSPRGQCRSLLTGAIVAVKVVKNKPAYFRQAMLETQILETLNSQLDPNNTHNIVRLLDTFVHRHHLCLGAPL